MNYVNYNDFYFNKTNGFELSKLIENSTPATLQDNLIRDALEGGGIDVDISLSSERANLIFNIINDYNCTKCEREQIQGGFCRNITVRDNEHCLSEHGRLLLFVRFL